MNLPFFLSKSIAPAHEFIEIPEGFSYFGSNELDPYANEKEKPLRQVFITTFKMSKYPTTVEQFVRFLNDTGDYIYANCSMIIQKRDGTLIAKDGFETHPVTGISWEAANQYCKWLSQIIHENVVLPSEAEWEKAARGEDSRIWPWGNIFESKYCISSESKKTELCSVYDYKEGKSPYGIMHLSGNVWEWCQDYWHPSICDDITLINPINLKPSDRKVVKGGSAYCSKEIVRIACRDWTNSINQGGGDDGFRVCIRPTGKH